jgi:hypothetical protein
MHSPHRLLVTLVTLFCLPLLQAEISLDAALVTSGYTQSFDSLSASSNFAWQNDGTVAGWHASTASGSFNASAKVSDGGSNASDLTIYSVGGSGSSDRALTYHTRVVTAPTYLGLGFINQTGSTLAGFMLDYVAEQWKEGTNNRTLSFEVAYRVGATASDLNSVDGWTVIPDLSVDTLDGATGRTVALESDLVLASIPSGSTIWFRWKLSNSADSSTSSNDILAIDNVAVEFQAPADLAPSFTLQPLPQRVSVGGSATFTVAADGYPAPTLQWLHEGEELPGETSATLSLTNVQLAQAGEYRCRANNDSGNKLSDPVTLSVSADPLPPLILVQPVGGTGLVDGRIVLTAEATGSAPLNWAWFRNGSTTALPGATGPELVLDPLVAGHEGSYVARVSNSAGNESTNPATVHVVLPPTIGTHPISQSLLLNASGSFSVSASGEGDLSYQWLFDDEPIPGATSATYSFTASAAAAGPYAVEVTNDAGSTLSDTAILTVLRAPQVTVQPQGAHLVVGGSHTFTVGASGSEPFSYQWFEGTKEVPNATTASLALSNVTLAQAGNYTVRVTNSVGQATSNVAVLQVSATAVPPTIATPPSGFTAAADTTASLRVVATGTAPFTYTWYHNNEVVPGQTSATLTFSPLQESDAGTYRVEVRNDGGQAESQSVQVTVTPSTFRDFYVSPEGEEDALGTLEHPTTLTAAIERVEPGYTILLRGGTYHFSKQITIARTNSGTGENLRKQIFAYTTPEGITEEPVLDFSSQPYGKTSQVSNPRGIQINGHWWHLRGLRIYRAADNGIYVAGHHNIIERCITHGNRDTGIQLGRYASSVSDKSEWPSWNLILNCESYDNYDEAPNGGENADGFAAKLTSGVGNVFRGCIAHHNIDDGWDLYTKNETGPIFPVTIDQCIAYRNGTLTDGRTSTAGDRNGFKLGGEKIAVIHTVTRSIAFGNGKNGFTWNSNPGAIRMFNNLAFDNAQGNYKFDLPSPIFLNNLSLYTSEKGQNDRYGGNSGIATGDTNCFWYVGSSSRGPSINDAGLSISAASFVTLTPPVNGFARRVDGSIDLGDFARPVPGSALVDAGAVPAEEYWPELVYDVAVAYEGAPDVGPVEQYDQTPITGEELLRYALGVSAEDANAPVWPVLGLAQHQPSLTFFRLRPNVTYTVEVSEDLILWDPLVVDPGQVGEWVEVVDSIDSSAPRRFLRLRVELTDE